MAEISEEMRLSLQGILYFHMLPLNCGGSKWKSSRRLRQWTKGSSEISMTLGGGRVSGRNAGVFNGGSLYLEN